jgi:hypothetical protein
MSTFEDRLWSQLVEEYGDELLIRPGMTAPGHRRRRRPALITGTALVATSLTAAAVLGLSASTSTPPAFAVTDNTDGTVTVKLKDIADLTALNAELAREGIPAQAIPLSRACPVHAPMVIMPSGTAPNTYAITIVPSQIPAGYTGVLAASQTALGRVELVMGAIKPPLPPCFNSTPMVLDQIDPAHASPTVKAAIARAREALAHAKR